MNIKQSELRELVEQGLVTDIMKMEKAYYLIKEITVKGSDIEAYSAGSYVNLFRIVQRSLLTDAILAVSRLYEKPSSHYPTLCIQSLLNFISENSSDLTPLTQQPNLIKHLYRINVPEYIINLVDSDPEQYGKKMADYFRFICFSFENDQIIEKLKNIRDKRIAHNENTTFISTPTLLELRKLIDDAKNLAGIIGWDYLNIGYVYEDKYFLSDDAQMPSIALRKLFKELNL